jgi:hypothetical protein
LDNIIRGKDLRSWNKERNDKNESILMSTLMFPQLTNQQFINCAYLEILPFYVSLVFVVPVPCACTGYLYVPYSGHVMGTGQTETMEVSDSLSRNT